MYSKIVKPKAGDFVLIKAKLVESSNKVFGNYNFILSGLNKIDYFAEDRKIIFDKDNVKSYNGIIQEVKSMCIRDIKDSKSLNYLIGFRCNDKLVFKFAINNYSELLNILSSNNYI